MSALYGTLTGSGAQVSRTGTKASGIRSQLQTFHGAIAVELQHDGTAIVTAKHPKTGRTVPIWSGNVDEILKGEQ